MPGHKNEDEDEDEEDGTEDLDMEDVAEEVLSHNEKKSLVVIFSRTTVRRAKTKGKAQMRLQRYNRRM